ncbi:MAG: lipopolysaccharide biosynthesis protein [Bacteroidetes bacterium]|nr:lipopolysaccharide biosynthesis protein [Bacteroidota bacterium]
MSELKQKAIKGIVWDFFGKGGTQVIQFLIGILIARILVPEDYGLIGMLMIFLVISQTFINAGFSAALVQRGKSITQKDYSTIFYFNLIAGLILYSVLFYFAPHIASFYNEPRLILLARVIGINLIIMSLGMIQNTIYVKKINFKTTAKIALIAILFSSLLGFYMAIKGCGVWSLAVMILSENLLRTILLWYYSSWKPSLVFSMKSFKDLFLFGSNLLVAGLVNSLGNNIYSMVIGKYYSTIDVGYFSQAKKIQERTSLLVTQSIQSVLFPTLSLIKDEISRYRNSVRSNVKATTFLVFPMIFGLIAISEPFVRLLLTEKWLPSVVYIQLLSAGGIFYTLSQINYSVCIVIGRANFYMKYTIASNIILIGIISLCLLIEVNLFYLIVGKIVWQFFDFIFFFIFIRSKIKYKLREYISDVFPSMIVSIVMGAIVYFIGYCFGYSWSILIIQILCGILVFVLLNLLLNKKLITEMFRIVFSSIKNS